VHFFILKYLKGLASALVMLNVCFSVECVCGIIFNPFKGFVFKKMMFDFGLE